MISINIDQPNRIRLQSMTPYLNIALAVQGLKSRLKPWHPMRWTIDSPIFGSRLNHPIAFATGDTEYLIPYPVFELQIQGPDIYPKQVRIDRTPEGFRMAMYNFFGDIWIQSNVSLEFDRFLNLTGISVMFGPNANPFSAVEALFRDLEQELPTVLGYIVANTLRGRQQYTLGEIHTFNVRGNHDSPSTQNLGAVREITNPRDNPTDITKRPHERAGHLRKLASGRVIEISPTVVHKDDYEPNDESKNPKF
jgi:hypothetical protein